VIRSLREYLSLILIALLPFHAFLVTVVTKVIAGPDHAPLGVLAFWKELLLLIILVIAFIELIQQKLKVESGKWKVMRFHWDWIDLCIAGLIFLAVIVSTLNFPLSTFHLLLGFKYDFLPLVAFLLVRRVPWSELFIQRVFKVVIVSAVIIVLYGLLSLILPASFFRALGYSDLHSLYVPGGPLAPFQQIGGGMIRRMQSVMSGPNQLGIWLLIPLSILAAQAVSGKRLAISSFNKLAAHRSPLIAVLVLVGILFTFSRAAWISAAVILLIAAWMKVPKDFRVSFFLSLGAFIGTTVIALAVFAPNILLRTASSRDHIARPLEAIQVMIAHPFGLGLGSAGPASNRTSDACVYLETGEDASWALNHADLCVFVGSTQVQPLDRECKCPFLPENWYLQIGVELGVIGFVLYITLIVLIVRLFVSRFSLSPLNIAVTFAFLGVSIASLFLHAWEESATAYSVWVISAMTLFKPSFPIEEEQALSSLPKFRE
jgi:hypothetical protein